MPDQNIAPANDYVALPMRSHTMLGICEGLGEDFGISPLWFRLPLGAVVLFNPYWAIGAYFALGLVVLASRLIFPVRNRVKRPAALPAPAAGNEARGEELPLAA